MSDLEMFETELSSLIGRPTDLRPFVCNGSPLSCEVFIVGLNPASPMRNGFWSFWHASYGFDKQKWLNEYIYERSIRPLKPGRTRRNKISNSRRVIEWINCALGPAKALETNLYSAPSEEFNDLHQHKRITAPFDFLLDRIRPKIVIAHGDDAISHIRKKKVSAKIFEVSHFSRGWGERTATNLGAEIRSFLGH
ncbi:hypothetical protein [Achromobacter sp. NCFB-sbj8-Ac1-l]|uniref:hypothetical protein n=1 Tax=unclassified Achromobacter TaxID=2626865 RepID=UPI0040468F8F